MDESLVAVIVRSGGFATLAAFAIFSLYKMSQAHTGDLKAGSERERLLTERVIDVVISVQGALVANTAAVQALQSEAAGLRASNHTIANFMAEYQVRMQALEQASKGRP